MSLCTCVHSGLLESTLIWCMFVSDAAHTRYMACWCIYSFLVYAWSPRPPQGHLARDGHGWVIPKFFRGIASTGLFSLQTWLSVMGNKILVANAAENILWNHTLHVARAWNISNIQFIKVWEFVTSAKLELDLYKKNSIYKTTFPAIDFLLHQQSQNSQKADTSAEISIWKYPNWWEAETSALEKIFDFFVSFGCGLLKIHGGLERPRGMYSCSQRSMADRHTARLAQEYILAVMVCRMGRRRVCSSI